MANEDLGIKRDCPNCGARFYDLKKDPALCPKCEHEFTPEILLKPRRGRAEEEPAKPAAEKSESEDDDDELAAEGVTSLVDAEKEASAPTPSNKGTLDDQDEDDEEDDDQPIDEDDNTTILSDETEEDALSGVVPANENNDDR